MVKAMMMAMAMVKMKKKKMMMMMMEICPHGPGDDRIDPSLYLNAFSKLGCGLGQECGNTHTTHIDAHIEM